ncbi:TetR/AcrR family transcriptional regulator [Flavobacterium silvaticum]|uniref:TetR/AcrR family transcriptional regulator n=1 Tax=Flavobacterium silvaticum TaxID=1852020 RepID=A0A972JI87_9FLAO|nr:TetR/AcrR family transcriptional regulator [Flavobacterium silvaticum]NMH28740.1 TetR/AcrR family transcriptional regulator [Flavobacterium silvaticum]
MARCVEFNECEIIEKAMNVFWEKGYHATSMQDLVDAMQINRSSLYNTIGDKHALFLKCVKNYTEGVLCETREKISKEKSALQALVNIIKDKAAWVANSDKGCLGIKTIFEIAPEDESVRNVLSKNNEVYLIMLSDLIQKAIDDKELNVTEDASFLAEYIMTTFTGWKQAFILNEDPIMIKKMSEFLIKSITHK